MTGRNGNTNFGKIYEPFTCCDPLFYVYNNKDELRWKIHTDYCQCGVCCRNDCGKCHEVVFPIYSGDKEVFDPNESKGYVKKLFAGLQEMISDADTFQLVFPVESTPEERLMLIGTVLMIDYRFYEDNKGNRRNRGYYY